MFQRIILLIFFTAIIQAKISSSLFNNKKVINYPQDYDIKWSQQMNVFTAVTNCEPSQILSWNCKICSKVQKPTDITVFKNDITFVQGFVGYLPSLKRVIVSFRGSKDIKNWIQDFSYQLIKYPRCQQCFVHAGFYTTFYSVQINIMNALKILKQKYSNPDIYVTGSSLGAALATIAGLQIQNTIGNVKQLHLFGCPRSGNHPYSQYITRTIPKVWRVIHDRDIVPHVPMNSQNFYHPPYEILFDQGMKNYKICDSTGEDTSCSKSFAPDYSISDHLTYWEQPIVQDVCTINQ